MGVNMVSEIDKLVKSLQKEYGSLKVASDDSIPKELISTGIKSLDLILEGGIAWGHVAEYTGLSSSGKTTLMQMLLSNAQKKYNAIGVWLDREKAWSNDRAKRLGIDLDNVMIINPENIPSAIEASKFLEKVLSKINKDVYKFIAIDSISAFDDPLSIDKIDMGKRASQFHRFFRKIIPNIDERASLNISNHITYKPGIVYGNPKTTAGGESPKYYSSFRIELNELHDIIDKDKGDEEVGNWIKATVIKTRRGPNFRKVEFPHFYKEGIPYLGGYERLLVNRNILIPKNKKLFDKFEETALLYKDKKFKMGDIETILEEFPELNFSNYPEYNIDNKQIVEDENE